MSGVIELSWTSPNTDVACMTNSPSEEVVELSRVLETLGLALALKQSGLVVIVPGPPSSYCFSLSLVECCFTVYQVSPDAHCL